MVEQLGLSFEASIKTCECGCGRQRPPASGRGRPAVYATDACRLRAHRMKRNSSDRQDGRVEADPGTETAKGSFAPLPEQGLTTAAIASDAGDARSGYWRRCPVCSAVQHHGRTSCWMGSDPNLWVTSWGIGFCACCGWEVPS